MKKTIIMGAGPAGLAAGYELTKKGISAELYDVDKQVGGISKTINYKDYYFDLGGHRFFTKSNIVNELWNEVLGVDFQKRPRLSRIFYSNHFFNYPLTPANALFGVGIFKSFAILASYFHSKVFPYKTEETFEEWVSNRFGKKLYSIFFKTYTEKVWGIPCSQIQAEWAAQRIKGLSLKKAIINAFFKGKTGDVKTLIDEFLYPTYGPGMMYQRMHQKIEGFGGSVKLNTKVNKVFRDGFNITGIEVVGTDGEAHTVTGSDYISSVPITELIKILTPAAPEDILKANDSLSYRSLITVNVIINKKDLFPDNWIYIHSPEVRMSRIQNFKNWSPSMVPDEHCTSLGVEYHCSEDDVLWSIDGEALKLLASTELEKLGLCNKDDVIDFNVVKVPKAYPVYSVGYRDSMDIIEMYFKKFTNLQLIGRYGLFKYNNMDHSILTGLYAAWNILSEIEKRRPKPEFDVWNVNADDDYHEENIS